MLHLFFVLSFNAPFCIKVPHRKEKILQLAVKTSDEESSRCDHGNGNQYAYLWLRSRVWENEIPIKLQVASNPGRGYCATLRNLLWKSRKALHNKSRLFKGNGNSEKEKIYMRYVIVWRTFPKDSPFQKSTFLMKILGSVTFDLNIQKGWSEWKI